MEHRRFFNKTVGWLFELSVAVGESQDVWFGSGRSYEQSQNVIMADAEQTGAIKQLMRVINI